MFKKFGSDKNIEPVALQLDKGSIHIEGSYRGSTEEWGLPRTGPRKLCIEVLLN